MTAGPLVPHLDVPHEDGHDLVWCATLALAWKALQALVGGPLVLEPRSDGSPTDHDRALSLVRALNASPVTENVAAAASYLNLAGEQTPQFIEAAASALRAQFGAAFDDLLPAEAAPGTLAALAAAEFRVPFAVPFARRAGALQFGGKPVDVFGLWERTSADDAATYQARVDQVRVHHHRFAFEYDPDGAHEAEGPSEEFVVELLSKNDDYRVIVGCFLPERTFAGTVALALSRLHDAHSLPPDARLTEREKLVVPVIDLDEELRLPVLFGRGIQNPGFQSHRFGQIAQRVRFELSEDGAGVRSSAIFGGLSLPPRSLICDAPFLVLLIHKHSAHPFLATWVETAHLLRQP